MLKNIWKVTRGLQIDNICWWSICVKAGSMSKTVKEEEKMEIHKRIQALRKEHSLSQEELANQLQVSRQAVSKWERGESKPEVDNIVTMAKIFGVTTDDILIDEKNIDKKSKKGSLDYNFFSSLGLIIVGVVLSFLLPLFAELYKGYCFEKWGECFTDAHEYIFQFPILGVMIIAILCLVMGILWFWKQYTRTRKN